MSTPRSIDVPAGVRRVTVRTARGTFAAFEATPASGVCERRPALLVPGFTGSKEDFLPVLRPLAAAGRLVTAIDMRGQYQTPGPGDRAAYLLAALAADIGAIAAAILDRPGAAAAPGPPGLHLLGHSFGGLVAREALLAGTPGICSLTLMSSGPGSLAGPAADLLRAVIEPLRGLGARQLAAQVKHLWESQLAVQARQDGTPPGVLDFLGRRMLDSSPHGLVAVAEQLLDCPDRTGALAAAAAAARVPILVLYGEHDDKWEPAVQEKMARRLGAQRVCVPGATHSPNVEAPEPTASALSTFWNAAEPAGRRPAGAADAVSR